MKKFTQILGLIGLVGLGVGFVALLIGQKANTFIYLHLLIGGGLALLGLLSNLIGLRDYFMKRAGKAYSGAVLQMLILLAIVFLLGFISYQHDRVIDVTSNRIYELSPGTKEILKQLPGEIKVTAFLPSVGYEEARQLLQLYQNQSQRIQLEFIDPDRHPELAEKYGISTYGTVVFDYSGQQTRIVDPREDRVSSALIKVSRKESWTIYFITGHGEADPEQQDKGGMSLIKQYLESQNYQVKPLQISAQGIPEDARVIVVAGPRMPYQQVEIEAIDHYLGKGGDAIFMLDPAVRTNLDALLQGYGAAPLPGIVIDPVNYLTGMDAVGLAVVANTFDPNHEITRELKGKLVAFPRTQALRIAAGPEQEGEWVPLVYSSASSFLETNLEEFRQGRLYQGPENPKGPLLLACAYAEDIAIKPWEQGEKKPGQIRIALLGNTFFMRNMALEIYSNYIMAINLFNWAAGEQELANIIPKARMPSRVFITARQTQFIFYSSVLIIPEMLCVLGLAVWWWRKK